MPLYFSTIQNQTNLKKSYFYTMKKVEENTPERVMEFELHLAWMAINEQLSFKSTFKEYQSVVVVLLHSLHKYITEDVLISTHKSQDIASILSTNPHLLKTGAHTVNADGTFTSKYLNVGEDYDAQPKDILYDYFFTWLLYF